MTDTTNTALFTEDAPTVKATASPSKGDDAQTEAEIVNMVRSDHKRARMAMWDWYDTARRCYDYVYGRQAPDDKNVFYLVFNLLIHRFLTKAGILTAGKPIASVSGRDTDDDDAGTVMQDLMEYGVDRSYLDALVKDAVQDQLMCGLGVLEERFLVHKKRWTEKHGWVPGDLVVTCENPMDYAFDPDNASERMDGENGPQYYTKISKVQRKKLQMLYPQKSMLIKNVSTVGDDFLRPDEEDEEHGTGTYGASDEKKDCRPTDKLVVIEYWYKKLKPIDVVLKVYVDEDGLPRQTDIARLPTMEEVEANPEMFGVMPEEPELSIMPLVDELNALGGFSDFAEPSRPELPLPPEVPTDDLMDENAALVGISQPIEYPFAEYGEPGALVQADNLPPITEDEGGTFEYDVLRTFDEQCWTASVVGNVLLYHKRSPYRHGRWPAVFFAGMLRRGEPCPYGQIDAMLVPQDVVNANLSLIQDNAARINNPGRVIKPDAFIESQKNRILDIVSQPGFTLVMDEGSPYTVDEVYREITPGQLPSQLLEFTNYIRQMIDEIASVAQVQRGGMPYDTSGKAIQSLLQASDTALSTVQSNIEYALTVWGENRVKNIQQFYALEDSLRISDDLRAYRMAFEYYTNPETDKTALSLVKYPEGEPGENPPEPKRIFDDFSIAEFDIRVNVKSNQERDPDEVTTRNLGYFDRGIMDKQYVIENDDRITGKRELLRRIQKSDQAAQMMENLNKLMDTDTPAGLLIRAVQNPEIADMILSALEQGGLPPEALSQVVAQSQAKQDAQDGVPPGPVQPPRTGAPPNAIQNGAQTVPVG